MAVRIEGWYGCLVSGSRVLVRVSIAGITPAILAESWEKYNVTDLYC